MKVKMRISVSDDWTAKPGDVVDLEDGNAERFLARGLAERVEEDPKPTKRSRRKPVETTDD